MTEALAQLGGRGPVLEFAVGTGRVALPLAGRGLPVHGIGLSPHMIERQRAKRGADNVAVTVGDMTSTRVPGEFTLVYLVGNVEVRMGQRAAILQQFARTIRGGQSFLTVARPGTSRGRLPSASQSCCDRTTVQVSHLNSINKRLTAHRRYDAAEAPESVRLGNYRICR